MKINMYIYSLSVNQEVLYVGVSKNPAKRLLLHKQGTCWKIRKELDKYKIHEISINILQVIKSNSGLVDKAISQCEFFWANKFNIDGHNLKNTLFKSKSKWPDINFMSDKSKLIFIDCVNQNKNPKSIYIRASVKML